jgi:hypothetical protein
MSLKETMASVKLKEEKKLMTMTTGNKSHRAMMMMIMKITMIMMMNKIYLKEWRMQFSMNFKLLVMTMELKKKIWIMIMKTLIMGMKTMIILSPKGLLILMKVQTKLENQMKDKTLI